jgi:tRNA-specific 2-thiouridylase
LLDFLNIPSEAQRKINSEKLVVVGMSGGVDSSVSAWLLKRQGFKVLGMFMKNWEEIDSSGQCTSESDYQDVAHTASLLDIPYLSVDFVKEYRENVFQHFLKEYELGHTPNPDILCNREIKFKVFYEKAMSLGADFLATGHYANTDGSHLLTSKDQDKDQTYFLYAINGKVLEKVLFPIGNLTKPEVRELAKEANLPTYNKKDSTGICFIGERKFREFLSTYIATKPGDFKTLDNTVVGQHHGAAFYTLGQRRGLGLGGPGDRWFVVSKDMKQNVVYVERGDQSPQLYSNQIIGTEESWLSGMSPVFPLSCMARIRHRQPLEKCMVTRDADTQKLKVNFNHPQRAVAARQSIVFYNENYCLGGAIIDSHGMA